MNSSMVIDGVYNNTAISSAQDTKELQKNEENRSQRSGNRDIFEKSTEESPVTYGKEEKLSASSGKDTLSITRSSKDRNVLVIHFRDSAEISRTIARGYLTVNGVRIDLSADVKKQLCEVDGQAQKDRESAFNWYTMMQNMKAAQQTGETLQRAADDMAKMMKIASRIAKGGKVPAKDEQKLMQYSPELYALAKSAAAMAKKHQKYESLLDDKEQQNAESEPDDLECKTYETQMSISMEGSTPQIQEISEAEADFLR